MIEDKNGGCPMACHFACLTTYLGMLVIDHRAKCWYHLPWQEVQEKNAHDSGKERSAATTLRLRLQNWNTELSITSIYQLDIIHSSLSTMHCMISYDRPAFFYHFALRIIVFLIPLYITPTAGKYTQSTSDIIGTKISPRPSVPC